ncbi:MAG: YihY/virulence factor BrkB family protein [Chloroflexia bacterium]|nr:YihY/virulence factor BrkB family protein [Chloroflexia bacterium]
MRLPGRRLIRKAQLTGDRFKVPPSPTLGVSRLLRLVARHAEEDYVSAFAAALAYRGVFASFLLLIFLLSLLGVFGATEQVTRLLDRVSIAMPQAVADLIREQIPTKATSTRVVAAFRLGAILSIIATLWGISSAFRSLMQAMNVMYKVRESRTLIHRIAISLLLSLAVAALMVSAGVLVIFGASIGERVARVVGMGTVFEWWWGVLQWPILIGFVLLAFALVYYFAPDVEQEFRFITPGSIIGLILWLAFSLLFLLLVNNFGMYNRVFGALAGAAIHMLYLYYFAYILLLGAEVNQVVEENSPGGKQAGEKVPDEQPDDAVGRD